MRAYWKKEFIRGITNPERVGFAIQDWGRFSMGSCLQFSQTFKRRFTPHNSGFEIAAG
jgi:hypothetical protein